MMAGSLRSAIAHTLGVLLFAGCLVAAASVAARAGERFAVIVANKDYRHASPVAFADRDAQAVEELLTTVYEIPRRNIERIDNASLADLRTLFGGGRGQRLGRIAGMVRGKAAELFVYVVGHGSRETLDGVNSIPYLIAADTDPSQLQESGYSVDVLVEQLEQLKRDVLPEGEVTLVLESCFSGRSNAGDLLTNRSAPLHGAPVVLSRRLGSGAPVGVRVLAAAQGDQYAAWDTGHRMSLFTDALVSGLFGEADDVTLGGNGDGAVTGSELRAFLERRMARRLARLEAGVVQTPDLVGLDDGQVVAEPKGRLAWIAADERRHGERIRSALLLANPDVGEIDNYLEQCLYCPNRDELSERKRALQRGARMCALEEAISNALSTSDSIASIRAFLGTCECCAARAALEARIAEVERVRTAALAPQVPQTGGEATSPRNQTPSTAAAASEPARLELEGRALTIRLQEALIARECLAGRADGAWGRGSRRALAAFLGAVGEAHDGGDNARTAPSVELLERIEGWDGRCGRGEDVASAAPEPEPEADKAPAATPPPRARAEPAPRTEPVRRVTPRKQERAECAAGQKRNSRGACYTPAEPRKPQTAAPKKASPAPNRQATKPKPAVAPKKQAASSGNCPANATAASHSVWGWGSISTGDTISGRHPCGRRLSCTGGSTRNGRPRVCSWL